MDRLSFVLSLLSVALIAIVLRSLRREHLRVEHSVSWLLAGMALLALSLSPPALKSVAAWLGLGEPAVALMAAILMVFMVVFYRFSRVVSELKDMNVTLVQRVAILEYQIEHNDGEDR
ncbi:MAG TPA: DUF2304 domain-containing protein [Bryobacteraceae bacterium]|nr:DUF2304 domain-containing protein [Bryobacteraceae bacterium]